MTIAPAITDIEQLKGHPALACLLAWNAAAVTGAKFDRDEMTIYVDRANIREACALLRDGAECAFNYLSDVTCVDWYPAEPRFEVVYHLLSIPKKERVRLKVRLDSASPVVESLTPLWPGKHLRMMLIWTGGPVVQEFSDAVLDQAEAEAIDDPGL